VKWKSFFCENLAAVSEEDEDLKYNKNAAETSHPTSSQWKPSFNYCVYLRKMLFEVP
jgi:hypothetical protein